MISTVPTLTDSGRALLLRAVAGETLTFTRIAIGSGELEDGQDQNELTALINEELSITPASLDDSQEGLIAISGDFTNADISADFTWTEVGIYAKGEDNVELLYAYANDGENAGVLKLLDTDILTEQTLTLIVEVDDDADVNVIYNPHAMYAPAATLTGHMNNIANPHQVTKAQVGLGNVSNTSPENTVVTFEEAQAQANIDSGEKLSVMFGKIKKDLTGLLAHLTDTNNPHGVSASDVGLGNVSNTSPENTVVTFEEAQERANIDSGESLATLFGKIKKDLTGLLAHLTDTNNPHGVSASDVGLGNVSNTEPSFNVISFEMANTNTVPSSGDTMAQIMGKVSKCLDSFLAHIDTVNTRNPHGIKLSDIGSAGTYTGDGTQGRSINLGFAPSAVILCNEFGQQFHTTKGVCGGIATSSRGVRIPASTSENDAMTWNNSYTALMLESTGFKVNYYSGAAADDSIDTNENNVTYHYIAYK